MYGLKLKDNNGNTIPIETGEVAHATPSLNFEIVIMSPGLERFSLIASSAEVDDI
jgi:hypothetical protein